MSLDPDATLQLNGIDVTAGQVIAAADIANLVFLPGLNENGSNYSSFTFSVQDDSGSFSASPNTLTFDVTPVNDAPSGADNTVTTNEDTAYTFGPNDFGFTDPDTGDALQAVRIDTLSLDPDATLQLNGIDVTAGQVIAAADIANLVFLPGLNENGSNYSSFTFSVQDDSGSFSASPNTFTFDVTPVNDQPSSADNTITTNEDTTYTFSALDFAFIDPDTGDSLSAVRINALPTADTLQLNGTDVTPGQVIDATDLGLLTFAPAQDANGESYASFTFQVEDQGGAFAASNTITFDVTPVNDAPVIDLNGEGPGTSVELSYTGGDGAASIAPDGLVFDIDSSDFGGGSLTVAFSANGTSNDQLGISEDNDFSVGEGGVLFYGEGTIGTVSGGADGGDLVVSFNAAADPGSVEALILAIIYSNDAAHPSTDPRTLTFTLVDGDGTANGGADTATAQAIINVEASNTDPVANNDTLFWLGDHFGAVYDDGSGAALAYVQAEFGGSSEDAAGVAIPAITLLSNDTDVDGDALSILSVDATSALDSALLLNGDGSITYTVAAALQALAQGEMVTDTFSYTVSDGNGGSDTATAKLVVYGMNDPAENATLPAPFAFDNLNAAVSVSGLSVADIDHNATVSTTLSVSDGILNLSAASGVTITGNGTDAVTISGAVADVNGVLASFDYLATNFVGTDTLTISTTDGIAAADVDTVAITVNPGPVTVGEDGTIYGSAGPDVVTGGSGDDSIRGFDGNDTLDGGPGDGADHLWGEGGDDTLIGGGGNDELVGGDGNDHLSLGDGNDTGWGDAGDDTIDGGDGVDTIYGGDGNDTLIGGNGSDFVYGQDGNDTIWLDDLNNVGTSTGDDQAWGGPGNDEIHGGPGNDTIVGDEGNDTLYGDGGNDFLYGSDGNDTLYGGLGINQYSGGNGSDTLYFGAGTDTGWGGADGDAFVFSPGNPVGIVKDFGVESATSHDLMVFAGFTSTAITLQAMTVSGVAGTQVSIGGQAVAFLEGVAPGTLGSDDFSFIS